MKDKMIAFETLTTFAKIESGKNDCFGVSGKFDNYDKNVANFNYSDIKPNQTVQITGNLFLSRVVLSARDMTKEYNNGSFKHDIIVCHNEDLSLLCVSCGVIQRVKWYYTAINNQTRSDVEYTDYEFVNSYIFKLKWNIVAFNELVIPFLKEKVNNHVELHRTYKTIQISKEYIDIAFGSSPSLNKKNIDLFLFCHRHTYNIMNNFFQKVMVENDCQKKLFCLFDIDDCIDYLKKDSICFLTFLQNAKCRTYLAEKKMIPDFVEKNERYETILKTAFKLKLDRKQLEQYLIMEIKEFKQN